MALCTQYIVSAVAFSEIAAGLQRGCHGMCPACAHSKHTPQSRKTSQSPHKNKRAARSLRGRDWWKGGGGCVGGSLTMQRLPSEVEGKPSHAGRLPNPRMPLREAQVSWRQLQTRVCVFGRSFLMSPGKSLQSWPSCPSCPSKQTRLAGHGFSKRAFAYTQSVDRANQTGPDRQNKTARQLQHRGGHTRHGG